MLLHHHHRHLLLLHRLAHKLQTPQIRFRSRSIAISTVRFASPIHHRRFVTDQIENDGFRSFRRRKNLAEEISVQIRASDRDFHYTCKSSAELQRSISSEANRKALLATQLQNHWDQFHPNLIVMVIYCVLLFLIIDIVAATANSLMMLLTGLELESSSNQPYLATSIQDFWGRWNLLVTNTLRYTIYKPVRLTFSGRYWAPLAGVTASFLVSGLMHELFLYQLSREKPTWEMTSFFMIHGICVAVEMTVKRRLAGGRWRLPPVVSTPLTVGFVVATGFWLFFPPLMRSGLDVKVLNEYEYVVGFLKNKLISLYSS